MKILNNQPQKTIVNQPRLIPFRLALLSGLACVCLFAPRIVLAQVTDDFNDGDDVGWSLYFPFSPPSVTFPAGGYRLSGGSGLWFAISYRADANLQDFVTSVDITDWTDVNQLFGIFSRLNVVGGQPSGFAFYCINKRPSTTASLIGMARMDNLGSRADIAKGVVLTLDHGKTYRMVFTGVGTRLTGQMFELTDGGPVLLGTVAANDANYLSGGANGLLAYDRTGGAGSMDATFDNFSAISADAVAAQSHLNDTWALPMTSGAWTQLSPGPDVPGARRFFPHAHDTLRNRLIIAGGLGDTETFFDTWALDLNVPGSETWTLLDSSYPHSRFGRAGLYDSLRDQFVVIHTYTHIDVLDLTANTWSSILTTGTTPEPLVYITHSAFYDALNDRYVVFGGGSGTDPAAYTFRVRALDPKTMVWSDIVPSTAAHPTARSLAGAVYGPAEQRLLLFGGALPGGFGAGSISLNDTWQFDLLLPGLEVWNQFSPQTTPLDRAQQAVAFDTARNRMVIFGGLHYMAADPFFLGLNDTWAFDGVTWKNLASAGPRPIARRGAAGVYDAVNDRFVIFGGQFLPGYPELPPEPTDLSAALTSETTAVLSWSDNAENESSYVVQRTCAAGSPQIVATLPADSNSYTDSTLSPCAHCTYVVRAVHEFAASPDSDPATVFTDLTPPVVEGPTDISVACSLEGLAPVTFAASASDNCDPAPVVTCSPASGSGFPVGITTVTCTATDASGNSSTRSFTVTRAALGFAGFLAPIGGADATGGSFASPVRTFKNGSTIPVKFTASCDGAPVLTGVHRLQAVKYASATTGDEPIDATPQDTASTGNQFRLADSQWHFNLDTKGTGMSVGIWQLIATLSDGSQHHVWIALK